MDPGKELFRLPLETVSMPFIGAENLLQKYPQKWITSGIDQMTDRTSKSAKESLDKSREEYDKYYSEQGSYTGRATRWAQDKMGLGQNPSVPMGMVSNLLGEGTKAAGQITGSPHFTEDLFGIGMDVGMVKGGAKAVKGVGKATKEAYQERTSPKTEAEVAKKMEKSTRVVTPPKNSQVKLPGQKEAYFNRSALATDEMLQQARKAAELRGEPFDPKDYYENLDIGQEFLNTDKTLTGLFQEFNSALVDSSSNGAVVSVEPLIAYYKGLKGRVTGDLGLNDAIDKRIAQLQNGGDYTLPDAQSQIRSVNERIDPTKLATKEFNQAKFEAGEAAILRALLDKAVDTLPDGVYQNLKNRYGAVAQHRNSLADTVNRHANTAAKNAGSWLDMIAGIEGIRGALTLNPKLLVGAVAAESMASLRRWRKDPNRNLQDMYKTRAQLWEPREFYEPKHNNPQPPPPVFDPSTGKMSPARDFATGPNGEPINRNRGTQPLEMVRDPSTGQMVPAQQNPSTRRTQPLDMVQDPSTGQMVPGSQPPVNPRDPQSLNLSLDPSTGRLVDPRQDTPTGPGKVEPNPQAPKMVLDPSTGKFVPAEQTPTPRKTMFGNNPAELGPAFRPEVNEPKPAGGVMGTPEQPNTQQTPPRNPGQPNVGNTLYEGVSGIPKLLADEIAKEGGGAKGIAKVAAKVGVPAALLVAFLKSDDEQKKRMLGLPMFAGLLKGRDVLKNAETQQILGKGIFKGLDYMDEGPRAKNMQRLLNFRANKLSPAEPFTAEDATAIAHHQRGEPEMAMLKIQHVAGGGVLGFVVEHVGDLTHRMTEFLKYGKDRTGYEYVKDKVNKTLNVLEKRYGFEREMNENIDHNAKSRSVDKEVFQSNIDKALQEYADEHRKIPTKNAAQKLAQEAAVALGEKRWSDAIEALKVLKSQLIDGDTWKKFSTRGFEDQVGKSQPKGEEIASKTTPEKGHGNTQVGIEEKKGILPLPSKNMESVLAESDMVDGGKRVYHATVRELNEDLTGGPMWFAMDKSSGEGWLTRVKDGAKEGGFKVVYGDIKEVGKIANYKDQKVKDLFNKNGVDLNDYIADLTSNASRKEIESFEGTRLLKDNGYEGLIHYDYDPKDFNVNRDSVLIFNPSDTLGQLKKLKAEIENNGGGAKGIAKTAMTVGVPAALLAKYLTGDDETRKKILALPVMAATFVPFMKGDEGGFTDRLDKKSKVEISDMEVAFEPEAINYAKEILNKPGRNTVEIKLPDLITHEELFNRVPELNGVKVHLKREGSLTKRGEWDSDNNIITIYGFLEKMKTGDPMNTLAHEWQHAIQSHYKWAEGGSPKYEGMAYRNRLGGEQEADLTGNYVDVPLEERIGRPFGDYRDERHYSNKPDSEYNREMKPDDRIIGDYKWDIHIPPKLVVEELENGKYTLYDNTSGLVLVDEGTKADIREAKLDPEKWAREHEWSEFDSRGENKTVYTEEEANKFQNDFDWATVKKSPVQGRGVKESIFNPKTDIPSVKSVPFEKIVPVKLNYGNTGGKAFPTVKNPTEAELKSYTREVANSANKRNKYDSDFVNEDDILRYTIMENRDMYVWDAMDGTHEDVENLLAKSGLKSVRNGYIGKDGKKVRDYDPEIYR
jgi:hypothetical protein